MIIPLAVAVGAGVFGSQVNKAVNIDEKTIKRNREAFYRIEEAKDLIEKSNNQVSDSMIKVTNRKKSIYTSTLEKFTILYSNYKKYDPVDNSHIFSNDLFTLVETQVNEIHETNMSIRSSLSDNEVIIHCITRGFGGMMVQDSKRQLSIANDRKKIADVHYEQASLYVSIMKGVKDHLDITADLLAKMNLLSMQSINECEKILKNASYDRRKLNENENCAFRVCLETFRALKIIVDTPVLNDKGEILKESLNALDTGRAYLNKINSI